MIEMLLVVSLLGLMLAMAPLALNGSLTRTQQQVRLQSLLSAVQNCELKVQQQQRSLQLGSSYCPISAELLTDDELLSLPYLNADGTASRSAVIRIASNADNDSLASVVRIDKLTGRASIARNE